MTLARLEELGLNINYLESALAGGYQLPTGFVGTKILTPFLDNSGGLHVVRAPVFGPEGWRLVETKHGLQTEPAEVSFSVTYKDEQLERHALRAPADPAEIQAGAAVGIGVAETNRQLVWAGVELRKEYVIANTLQSTASYGAGFSETTAAGSGWNQLTGAVSNVDPVAVIRARMETVRQANGEYPNFVMFGKTAWDAFADNTYVTGRLAGGPGSSQNKENTKLQDVGSWLAIDEQGEKIPNVFVGTAGYRDEVNQTMVDLWGDCCIVGIRREGTMPSRYFGVTLQEVIAEMDGIPITGVAGEYESNPWKWNVYYMSWYKEWIVNNIGAYLILDVVK